MEWYTQFTVLLPSGFTMVNRARTAFIVIAAQATATLIVATAVLLMFDRHAAFSALLGGGICVFATGLFAARVLLGGMEWSPQQFLVRFYRAEIQKLVLMVVLLLATMKWLDASGLPLMAAFFAGLIANWLVLLLNV